MIRILCSIASASLIFSATLTTAAGDAPADLLGFTSANALKQIGLEKKFDGLLDPSDQRTWLKQMSAEPNHVGSPHDKANAEFMLAKFREWGWDARSETFEVLYPTLTKHRHECHRVCCGHLAQDRADAHGDRLGECEVLEKGARLNRHRTSPPPCRHSVCETFLKSYPHPMFKPLNQRHVTAQEALEQCRRNRRQAAILESRDGPQQADRPAARPTSPAVLTGRK